MLSRKEEIFSFIKIDETHLELIYKWFKEPHVEKWWPILQDKKSFFDLFLKRINSKEIDPYLVNLNGYPIAYIQVYSIDTNKDTWLPKLPKNTIGLDQFIGEDKYLGKGLGAKFIKSFIDYFIYNNSEITTIILDPDINNIAAIKCYEKVGFSKVGEYQNSDGESILLMKFDIKKINF